MAEDVAHFPARDRLAAVPVAVQAETPAADTLDADTPDADTPDEGRGSARAGRVGLALTYLSAATMPWTALGFGKISLGEIFLVLAVGALLAADLERRIPRLPAWTWTFVGGVVLVGVCNAIAPPSMAYLEGRAGQISTPTGGLITVVGQASAATSVNLSVTAHLVLRLILLPVAFGLALSYDRRAVFRATMWFVGGVCVSSLIAFTDSRGLTSIGPSLTGVAVADQRGAGLTDQANVVALTCVMGLPFALWQTIAGRRRSRALAILALLILLLGLYASRSRSGAAAAAAAGLVALLWLPQSRRHLPTIGFAFAGVAALLGAAIPSVGAGLLAGLRLSGGDVSGSDQIRTVVNDQAKRDFAHSPIHGIGMEVAEQAHLIYYQALAVGGILLLIAFVIYQAGSLVRCIRLAPTQPLAIALFASLFGEYIFNTVQNALTASIVYITAGMVAVLPLALEATEEVTPG